MLKEMIEHIQKTALPTVVEVDGVSYALYADGVAAEIRPNIDHPDTLPLSSLDALVKLVKTEALRYTDTPLYITIPDHLTVRCFSHPAFDERGFRQIWYEATAADVPGWDPKVTLPFEEMQIALRTRFQETPDQLYAMRLLSEISMGAKITFNDNGVATSIVTRKGVDLQANESIKPIVALKPYRTFQEVEQPESTFLIRVNERGITFIESDGGMWKLHARETVRSFLGDALEAEIADGRVFVAL